MFLNKWGLHKVCFFVFFLDAIFVKVFIFGCYMYEIKRNKKLGLLSLLLLFV